MTSNPAELFIKKCGCFPSIAAEFFVANVVIFPTDLAEFAGKLMEHRGVPSTLAENSIKKITFSHKYDGVLLKIEG